MRTSLSSIVIRTTMLYFVVAFSAAGVCDGLEPVMDNEREQSLETPSNTSPVHIRFEKLYEEWQEYMDQPLIMVSSLTSVHIEAPAYREIVKLGEEALPYLIEKMESGRRTGWGEGQFFLWHAVREISGVDLTDDSLFYSEQEMTARYISWWNDKQKNKRE